MSATIGYHPLVQKDLNEALDYYDSAAGPEIADRIENEFRMAIHAIRAAPRHFSFYQKQRRFRRCLMATFPQIILFRETGSHVRIMVLKHVKRAPSFAMTPQLHAAPGLQPHPSKLISNPSPPAGFVRRR